MWVRSCRGTSPFSLNRFGHIEQVYGFSPVWVRSCRGTSVLLVKRFGHMEQAYGFSPVWICSRTVASRWQLNVVGQNEQLKGASLAWPRSCVTSFAGTKEKVQGCMVDVNHRPGCRGRAASLDGTSAAPLEAVTPVGGPSSGCCCETRLAAGRRGLIDSGGVLGVGLSGLPRSPLRICKAPIQAPSARSTIACAFAASVLA